MAVKSKDEILEAIRTKFEGDDSDDTLSFIEDVSDTMDDMSEQIDKSGEWKAKYEQNDKEWREKYKQRFFSKPDTDDDDLLDPPTDPITQPKRSRRFEDLFSTNK